jgi:hypothetical protein
MLMGFACVRYMYILLIFLHESVCLQNIFVCFKFYIYIYRWYCCFYGVGMVGLEGQVCYNVLSSARV